MSADTPPVEPAAPQETGSAPAPDMGAIMSRMDELSTQVQSLSQPSAQDDGPDWNGGGISDLPFQDYADQGQQDPYQQGDPYGQPQDPYSQQYQPGQYQPQPGQDPYAQQQQVQQQLDTYINQRVQQGIDQHVTPFIQRQKAEALESRYPALKDPAQAAAVVKATAQYAQRLGRPELARDPELVELVHLAQTARDRASQETPADGGNNPEVHLEGSGAAPQAEEMDEGDRMLTRFGIDPNNPYG